jgi:hypothetical protein
MCPRVSWGHMATFLEAGSRIIYFRSMVTQTILKRGDGQGHLARRFGRPKRILRKRPTKQPMLSLRSLFQFALKTMIASLQRKWHGSVTLNLPAATGSPNLGRSLVRVLP